MNYPIRNVLTSTWTARILLFLAPALAYGLAWPGSLQGPFIFQDFTAIPGNPSIQGGSLFGQAFLPPDAGPTAGLPLLNLSLALNWTLHGQSVFGYHLANLVIHILAGLTLFGLLRMALASPGVEKAHGPVAPKTITLLALVCALLWVAHPLQTSAVTYISQRGFSLMGLLFLLCLFAAAKGFSATHKKGRALWHLGALCACLAGTGANPGIMAAPFLVFLYDMTFHLKGPFRALKDSPLLYAGLALCLAVLAPLAHGYYSAEMAAMKNAPDIGVHLLTQPGVVFHYLGLAFKPLGLCLDYAWPPAKTGEAYPFAFVLMMLTGGALWSGILRHPLGFAACFFFLALAPHTLPPLSETALDQRMYLALAPVVCLTVFPAYAILRRVFRLRGRVALMLLALPLVLCLVWLTRERNMDYRSRTAIWTDTLEKRPENVRAHRRLGMALESEGRTKEAIQAYTRTLKLDPGDGRTHLLLGTLLLHQAGATEALYSFRQAVFYLPESAEAHLGLADAYTELGETDKARQYYARYLELTPNSPDSPDSPERARALKALGSINSE